jgi:hypothetical protein
MAYKCFVTKVQKVIPIPKADNIQSAIVLGNQVVVSKNVKAGDLGLFFPADCQLSEDFCKYNNLFRDSSKNINSDVKGFFDDNRRVRCQPFMKVRSEGYFCGLGSLDYLFDLETTKGQFEQMGATQEGTSFDKILGIEICRKYISPQTQRKLDNQAKNGKKIKKIETPMFNKHVDTDQFDYYVNKIPKGALLSFHAKIHGTSARMAYTKVVKQPEGIKETINNILGKKLFKPTETWEYVVGTRNVVLYHDDSDKEGFHGSEQFRFDAMEQVKPYLDKGMTVYAELSGYANGNPIMGRHDVTKLKDKKYTKKYGDVIEYSYGCKENETRLDIYRISYTNEDGRELDMTYPQMKSWCESKGLNCSMEVSDSYIYTGTDYAKKKLIEYMELLSDRPESLTEDYYDSTHINEGVILRVDYQGQVPKFYKKKSYAFKVMENIYKTDNLDIEDAN